MPELIDFGSFQISFLRDKHETGGAFDLFELDLPPTGRMPVPHCHESWEETVYGLRGVVTYIVEGKLHHLGPGMTLFIPRGKVHGFDNRTNELATCLCLLTPGVIGPEYFRELAALLQGGDATPEKARAIMLRYGLMPG